MEVVRQLSQPDPPADDVTCDALCRVCRPNPPSVRLSHLPPQPPRCSMRLFICYFGLHRLQLVHIAPLLLQCLSALDSIRYLPASLLPVPISTGLHALLWRAHRWRVFCCNLLIFPFIIILHLLSQEATFARVPCIWLQARPYVVRLSAPEAVQGHQRWLLWQQCAAGEVLVGAPCPMPAALQQPQPELVRFVADQIQGCTTFPAKSPRPHGQAFCTANQRLQARVVIK